MVLCARIAIFLFSTACATKQVHKVAVLIRHCQIIGEVSHWRNIVRIAKLPLPTVLSGEKVRWVLNLHDLSTILFLNISTFPSRGRVFLLPQLAALSSESGVGGNEIIQIGNLFLLTISFSLFNTSAGRILMDFFLVQ